MMTMVIFDVVVSLIGLYLFYSALKMKKTGEISSMLVAKEEMGRCKDKAAFIEQIYKKEAVFGIAMAVVGVLELLDELVFSIRYADIVEMLAFLVFFVWFCREYRKALSECFL